MPNFETKQNALLSVCIRVFHFVRQKIKCKIFADFAYAPSLSDVKDIYAKFQEDWIIFRGCTL